MTYQQAVIGLDFRNYTKLTKPKGPVHSNHKRHHIFLLLAVALQALSVLFAKILLSNICL